MRKTTDPSRSTKRKVASILVQINLPFLPVKKPKRNCSWCYIHCSNSRKRWWWFRKLIRIGCYRIRCGSPRLYAAAEAESKGLADVTRETGRIKEFRLLYSYMYDLRFALLTCLVIGFSIWWMAVPEPLLENPKALTLLTRSRKAGERSQGHIRK